jgi:hypothetical protein
MDDAHRRWRRQRRRHDDIENAVDDVAWGAGNLNRALEPRGCGLVVLAGLSALAIASSAVGWWIL